MKSRSGLRERKKRMQRQELLDVAARLFRQHGYDAARMDDIAFEANVSTKTVYNYFPNKKDILAALLQEDREGLVSAYEAVIADPPPSLPEAIATLMQADIGQVLTPDDKKLWRELIAAELRTTQTGDAALSENKLVFITCIERLLSRFKNDGIFCGDIPVADAADMIYAVYYYNFINYCRYDDLDIVTFRENLKDQYEIMVRSWE